MPIAPLMQRFVDDELARSDDLIARTRAGTLQLLRDPSGLAATERALQFELADALQRQAPRFDAEFIDTLRRLVADEMAGATGFAPETDVGGLDTLELMDESRVEADIEISRATQIIDSTAEWELRELQTFTSTLAGQTHVSADTHPLRPAIHASALWQATSVVAGDAARRALVLRTAAGVMAGLLKNAWAAACTRLESQGIEPGVYRTVLLTPAASVPARVPEFDVTRPGAFSGLLAGLPAGGALPPDAESRAELVRRGSTLFDPRVLDLMSRVFAKVAADEQVPRSFGPALADLQWPALRLALKDPALLDSVAHPMWQLVDRIGAAAAAWPQPGDPRSGALLVCCRHEVQTLEQTDTPDAAQVRRALARIEAFIGSQLDAQRLAARGTVDGLVLAERREVLEQSLTARLTDQMVPVRCSAGVRRFVTGAWARVLAEAMLSHGEQSELTRRLFKTVDDLLWSVQLPDHQQSRQRLIGLLPGLLQSLRDGMALIAMSPGEQQAVLDELMAIHTEVLRPGQRPAGTALTPEQIVQRMRDEVITEAPVQRPFADSLIDLSQIETVPADQLPDEAWTADKARRVDTLMPGDWRRLFLRGRWTRVQLLWRSDRGGFFLFAGETPGRTHSLTRRALDRLSSAGLLQPVEASSLVQRAVDAMLRELSLAR